MDKNSSVILLFILINREYGVTRLTENETEIPKRTIENI